MAKWKGEIKGLGRPSRGRTSRLCPHLLKWEEITSKTTNTPMLSLLLDIKVSRT